MKIRYLITALLILCIKNIFAIPVVDLAWEDGYNIQGRNNTGKKLFVALYAGRGIRFEVARSSIFEPGQPYFFPIKGKYAGLEKILNFYTIEADGSHRQVCWQWFNNKEQWDRNHHLLDINQQKEGTCENSITSTTYRRTPYIVVINHGPSARFIVGGQLQSGRLINTKLDKTLQHGIHIINTNDVIPEANDQLLWGHEIAEVGFVPIGKKYLFGLDSHGNPNNNRLQICYATGNTFSCQGVSRGEIFNYGVNKLSGLTPAISGMLIDAMRWR